MIEEIRKTATDFILGFNMYQNHTFCQLVDNDELHEKHRKFGSDFRLSDSTYRGSSLSLVYLDRNSSEVLGASSFFLYKQNEFKNINFWCGKDKNGLIDKISLADLACKDINFALTVGYTLMGNSNKSDFKITSSFIRLTKALLNAHRLFTFIECTGPESLTKELTERKCIQEAEDLQVNFKNIGVTRNESSAAEKFAVFLGLEKLPGIYNVRTLGPVYASFPGNQKNLKG